MDYSALMKLVAGPSIVEKHECVQVAGNRFVPADAWHALKTHEQQYVRSYAAVARAKKAVAVGRSAARIMGMWVLPAECEVELAMPNGHPPPKSQWPEGLVYRHMTIPDSDILTGGLKREVRCTTGYRTAVDIARIHGVREGVIAMDSLFRDQSDANKVVTWNNLQKAVERARGKDKVRCAREALEQCSPYSESPYETLMRLILLEHGIVVDVQQQIGKYIVDLLWGTLIIEIDGYVKFEDKPSEAVRKQLLRENRLKEMGYEVIRFFPWEIQNDPAGCIARILEAKARADARGPASVLPAIIPVPEGAGWVK